MKALQPNFNVEGLIATPPDVYNDTLSISIRGGPELVRVNIRSLSKTEPDYTIIQTLLGTDDFSLDDEF